MNISDSLKARVLTLPQNDFDTLALEVFRYQFEQNKIYRMFVQGLGVTASSVDSVEKIPFLPIEFFKSHTITSGDVKPSVLFESSKTTGQTASKHFVADPVFYLKISQQIFEQFYGSLTNYHILALLPSYLERNNSSLVYMVEHFIKESQSVFSGFYLNHHHSLVETLQKIAQNPTRKVILWGVTFALLDLAESDTDLSFLKNLDLIIMETGGMKGRRKELLREEIHQILCEKLNILNIHSEYGMTELLSQGYSKGEGVFDLSPSMKLFFREVNDPFTTVPFGKTGGVNVIDLANIDSCAFIETKDLGMALPNGQFKILGRFDNADVRGCNLMLA
jgi:hypothetical protein